MIVGHTSYVLFWVHLLSGWPKKSSNFRSTTKMVFPKSLKIMIMNSGSEFFFCQRLMGLCLFFPSGPRTPPRARPPVAGRPGGGAHSRHGAQRRRGGVQPRQVERREVAGAAQKVRDLGGGLGGGGGWEGAGGCPNEFQISCHLFQTQKPRSSSTGDLREVVGDLTAGLRRGPCGAAVWWGSQPFWGVQGVGGLKGKPKRFERETLKPKGKPLPSN